MGKFVEFESQQKSERDLRTSVLLRIINKFHFGLGIKKNVLKLLYKLYGTRLDEKYWINKYHNSNEAILNEYKKKNFRIYFLDVINKHPFKTALEIGSNWGPNLQMIASHLPYKKLIGVEINKECAYIGNQLFNKEGISNVEIINGNATRLLDIVHDRFDLVFSWACLMYVSSRDIQDVIGSIVKIANKRILLAEFHDPALNRSKWDNHWIHNYKKLFDSYSNKIHNLSITKISEMDASPTWQKYGYYIDIILK